MPADSTKVQLERNVNCAAADTLVLAILGIGCLLAFLPVLLWPHWGLYSDPRQILEDCRLFYSSPAIRWDLVWGFHRPGFHALDLGMWLVSKEHPVGFYAFRGLIFFATVMCTFFSSYKFSHWRSISALSGAALLLLTPTFEVIYTLDKGEVYLGCLFSIIIFLYLSVMTKTLNGACSTRWYFFASVVIFVCSAHAVLIKETGLLLAPLGLLLIVSCVFANLRTKPLSGTEEQGQIIKKKLLRWAFLAGGLCISTSLICKICFTLVGPSTTVYGAFSPSAASMLQQLIYFLPVIPDFFILFGFCFLRSLWMLCQRAELFETHNLFLAISLTLTAGAGSAALLVWKAPIVYSWYPLFVLLLPAVAYFLKQMTTAKVHHQVISLIAVTALLVCSIPVRLVQAQLQYHLDSCVQEMAHDIAASARKIKKPESYVIPISSSGGAELAEELKILTISELIDNFIPGAWTAKDLPVLFCNFINYYFPPGVQPAANSLVDSDMKKLSYAQSNRYVAEPGLDKFFLANSNNGSSWTVDNLRTGDVLLVPFGNLPPSLASYRGTALFCTDWATKLAFSPQVVYKPIFVVSRKLVRIGGHPFTIGWVALSIETIPKISWSISPSGNLYDGAQIFAAKETQGHRLVITAQMNRAMLLWQKVDGKELPVNASPISNGLFQLKVLLPESTREESATYLRLQTFGTFSTPSFLRVKSARIE